MTDPSAINIPVHTALTSDLQYGLKPSAPKSRSYRISIAPLNKSTFVGGDQIILELPTSRKNTFFDQSQSFLKFTVQVVSTAAAAQGGSGVYLDNSAYSFFQRLDVYNASNLLESINEYGQLCNMLIDTSLTQSDKAGLSSMIGTNYTANIQQSAAAYAQYGTDTVVNTPGDRSGMSLATNTTLASTTSYTFTLPLLSGVVGINASKCLPVGALNSPVHIELYLDQNDNAITYGTAGAGAVWTISNVEFDVCYIELYDDVMSEQFHQGIPQYISTNTWRQASTYMPASTSGEFSTLLPFRGASINGLYAKFRNYATAVQGANGTAAYRKSSSISPNLSSFYFRVGSSIYPNKPIYLNNGAIVGSGAEAYAELIKSFHALSSSVGNTAILYNQYNVAPTAVNGWASNYVPGARNVGVLDTSNNAFMIGLELQSFSNRNDTILSGVSTLNSQIYFTGVIQSGQTVGGVAGYNYTIDFFTNMDVILVIVDGIMSAKF
jgi:hypothetical protein